MLIEYCVDFAIKRDKDYNTSNIILHYTLGSTRRWASSLGSRPNTSHRGRVERNTIPGS